MIKFINRSKIIRTHRRVFVRLIGGLGNQIFQISAALDQASNSNIDLLILQDGSKDYQWVEDIIKNSRAEYEVRPRIYKCPKYLAKLSNVLLVCNLELKVWKGVFGLISLHLIKLYFLVRYFEKIKVYTPNNLGYANIPHNVNAIYLNGYFQSFRYSENINVPKSIIKMFPKNECQIHMRNLKKISKYDGNTIAMHVRRGDYLTNQHFGVLSSKYFEKALANIGEKFENAQVFLYSDDVKEAQKLFDDVQIASFLILENCQHNSVCTLIEMSSHRGFILSNSSFGWWAARLSRAEPRNILVPDPWFKDIESPKDIVPEDWTKISSNWNFQIEL